MKHNRYKVMKNQVYLAIDVDSPNRLFDNRTFIDLEDYQELEKQRDKLLEFLKSDNGSLMAAKELIDEVELGK